MAEIDRVGFADANTFGVGDDLLKWFRSSTADHFWNWYDQHRNEAICTLKVWKFIGVSVKVRHVKPLFEWLFGDR